MREPKIGDAAQVELIGEIICIKINAYGNKMIQLKYKMKSTKLKDYEYEETIEVPYENVYGLPQPDFDAQRLSSEGVEK